MITPDQPATTGTARTFKLPLALLAVEGTTPAEGDEVSVAVGGRITGISGDEATLEITTLNGEPLPADEANETSDEEVMDQVLAADKKDPYA